MKINKLDIAASVLLLSSTGLAQTFKNTTVISNKDSIYQLPSATGTTNHKKHVNHASHFSHYSSVQSSTNSTNTPSK